MGQLIWFSFHSVLVFRVSWKLEVEDVWCFIGGVHKVFWTMWGIKMAVVMDGW